MSLVVVYQGVPQARRERSGAMLGPSHDAKESAMRTPYDSVSDLANALRRAAAAHGEHEARTGAADPDWPDWYAAYMVAEQRGEPLPS
jgi:hypothetical protein